MTPYYEDDFVTIYHGDAIRVLGDLPEVSFDALVADPPYSSGGAMRSDRVLNTVAKYVNSDTFAYRPEFSGDNRDQRSYLAWSTLWMNAALQASSQGSHILTFTDWRQIGVTIDAVQAGGWVYRGLATWWKPGIRMQRGGFSQSAEHIVWGTAGPWNRDNDHSPQNVLKVTPVQDKRHIAQKPKELMHDLVRFAPVGGTILDPFMGSGTTLLAAVELGRKAIGIDVEEPYCEMAARRFSQGILRLEAS